MAIKLCVETTKAQNPLIWSSFEFLRIPSEILKVFFLSLPSDFIASGESKSCTRRALWWSGQGTEASFVDDKHLMFASQAALLAFFKGTAEPNLSRRRSAALHYKISWQIQHHRRNRRQQARHTNTNHSPLQPKKHGRGNNKISHSRWSRRLFGSISKKMPSPKLS
jgi:hypothetical protein